jgi:hypothetical protein
MSAATWALVMFLVLVGAALAALGALMVDEATMTRHGRSWPLRAALGVLVMFVGLLVLVGAVLVGVWS